ncbi:alcohol dehydrogenase catalytic domain-containing protein [Fodinisporobacter ferrooxydans]|uniref:Alcohol dehydrogenase catalytic domain-containing protein n=1 Tax=Fodinisporobacter ferrooxydans TaxID=2901836 RepID=A0ABY4CP04_9BACL|nr:alcohol dehydrogenase catalytic domain-containing protein [Alicyclobacillaceae bacterium MYW30-H2]
MLELYLNNPNDMELREVESLPAPTGDEVKIQLIYGGICGSDLSVFRGKIPYASYPLRPGHELLGTIIETGESANYRIGTRVVVLPNTFCGECDLCLKGRTNICRHKQSIGVNANGGFSQEFVISSKYVLPVPDDLPDEKAVLIEPFAVVVHALKKVSITKDTTVAVVGCGNEGMLAVALANYLGARVTAIDINPLKLELVRSLGDIRAIHPQEIKDQTFDVVVEAAGTKASIEQGMQLVSPGGAMILIGITQEANLPVVHVVRSEITLYGTIIYNFPSDYLQTIEYLRNSEFNVAPIVSKIMPFTEYQKAYETALSGDFGKIILNFKEAPGQ